MNPVLFGSEDRPGKRSRTVEGASEKSAETVEIASQILLDSPILASVFVIGIRPRKRIWDLQHQNCQIGGHDLNEE